jgi:Cache 3/Cache 2 fusion domain
LPLAHLKPGRLQPNQSQASSITPHFTLEETTHMNRKSFIVGILAAGCFVASSMLMPSVGNAQDARVAKSIASLKAMSAKLGAAKLDGKEAVGGKDAPALYFGSSKINNNFDVVDAVSKEDGKGMTATFFVKSGAEYIRVSTSVPKPDGSGRAIGTILDPAGKAIVEINAGKAFYGEVTILGTPYITGYEPMKDGSGATIGIYYVGYKK